MEQHIADLLAHPKVLETRGHMHHRIALRLRNCAICQVRWADDRPPQLLLFNDTAHLQKQSPPVDRPNAN